MCFENLPIEFDAEGNARLKPGVANPYAYTVQTPEEREAKLKEIARRNGQLADIDFDPVTRVAGALAFHSTVDLEQRRVLDANSMATLFRGYEVILRGRDPRDAAFISSRACGVCGGVHSPYAASLLKHIETPGLELNFLFRIVHDEVLEETGGEQEPFVYGSLGATEIYLKPADAPAEAAPDEAPRESAPPPSAAPGTDEHLAELDYFAAISENTEDAYRAFLGRHPGSPRTAQINSLLSALAENKLWRNVADEDTIAAYQRYLAAFADGIYADEARTRMQRLIDDLRQVATRGDQQPPTLSPTPVPADDCGHPHGSHRVTGVASNDVLWVRAGPSRDAATKGSMPPDAQGIGIGRCVNVAGYIAQWCEVRYQCIAGWAYARYLTGGGSSISASTPETYRVVGVAGNDVLNMRTGPGTGHGIVTGIPPNGTGVRVSGCQAVSGYSSKWCTVTWQGISGWASACCLAGERTGRQPD